MAKRNNQNPEGSPTERDTAPDTTTEEATLPSTQPPEPQVQIVEKIVERVVYRDAPTPPPPGLPRQMRVERQGEQGVPMTRKWPDIRGGTCEFCGVQDRNQPSHMQYKLCNHYRGMQAHCTYCKPERDADDVINHTILNVYEDPYNAGTIIFCCSLSECMDKHIKRFTRSS